MNRDIITTIGSNVASNRVVERRRMTSLIATLFSFTESEREAAWRLEHIELESCWPDTVRRTIEKCEAVLAAHRSAINGFSAELVPVTMKNISIEIGDLILAFPDKSNLAEFIPLLFDHILVEHPSQLVLAAACHRLRCTKKFRPTISEVLEELAEAASRIRGLKHFANLEANLDKARALLLRIEAKPIQNLHPEFSRNGPHKTRADYLRQKELRRQEEEKAAQAVKEAVKEAEAKATAA